MERKLNKKARQIKKDCKPVTKQDLLKMQMKSMEMYNETLFTVKNFFLQIHKCH